MWCAYAFLAIALISLPAALASGDTTVLIAWLSSNCLQLVLLPVIMVGQRVQDQKHEAQLKSQQVLHDHLGTGHTVGE